MGVAFRPTPQKEDSSWQWNYQHSAIQEQPLHQHIQNISKNIQSILPTHRVRQLSPLETLQLSTTYHQNSNKKKYTGYSDQQKSNSFDLFPQSITKITANNKENRLRVCHLSGPLQHTRLHRWRTWKHIDRLVGIRIEKQPWIRYQRRSSWDDVCI